MPCSTSGGKPATKPATPVLLMARSDARQVSAFVIARALAGHIGGQFAAGDGFEPHGESRHLEAWAHVAKAEVNDLRPVAAQIADHIVRHPRLGYVLDKTWTTWLFKAASTAAPLRAGVSSPLLVMGET